MRSLRDADEADADEVEGVGGVAFGADDLAGGVADEFDAVAEEVDEVFAEAGEDGHAAEVRAESARPR